MTKELIGAMVTPFDDQDNIDYDVVLKLLRDYENSSHTGIVVAGTTGEESALTFKEKYELVQFVLNNTKLNVIVGIIENCTSKVLDEIEKFNALPIHSFLISIPYYNLPPQRGIFLHFKKIAAVSKHPIIIYNVMRRCGVSIEYQTIKKLLRISNKITGIKECNNDFNLIRLLKSNHPDFKVYFGNDVNFLKALNYKVDGIISISSILYGRDYVELIENYELGFHNELLEQYLDIVGSLITFETNPIPIKYLLSKHGYQSMNLRLPLVKLSLNGENAMNLLL